MQNHQKSLKFLTPSPGAKNKNFVMSLVWGLIAGFLYLELGIVLLLVLPVASPQKWARFFRSRFFAMLKNQIQIYFYLLVGILGKQWLINTALSSRKQQLTWSSSLLIFSVLFLLEAIREMRKYSHIDPAAEQHLNVGMQHSMRLFRAQRNFYIAGFAIFLTLVIRRLVTLLLEQAGLLAQAEASMKQAQSATAAARSMMGADTSKAEDKKDGDKAVVELKKRIAELETDLVRERKDKEAMKSQAESLNKEYDRLTEEYSKLQRKVTISASSDKDD